MIVDHYTWFYPLKLKSHVKDTFIRFKALTENKFNTKIGTLFSDNGGEFKALRNFLSLSGITHLTSPPHTTEHNGLAERRHRHIVETGLALFHHANLPNTYWSHAFSPAVYLINRLPTHVLNLSSPYASLFRTPPNYTELKILGCLCFPWLRPYRSNKLETRSIPCIFLGYSLTQSAFLCLEPLSGRIYVSRHIRFDETQFPFQALTKPKPDPTVNIEPWQPLATIIPTSSPPLVDSSAAPLGSDHHHNHWNLSSRQRTPHHSQRHNNGPVPPQLNKRLHLLSNNMTSISLQLLLLLPLCSNQSTLDCYNL